MHSALKSLKNKLLLLAAIIPTYGTYKSMWLHYTLMYLPFFSILAAVTYDGIKIYLYEQNYSKLRIVIVNLIFLLVLTCNGNILFNASKSDLYNSQKDLIEWVLRNIDRNEIITATGYLRCPAFIFNRDFQHQWTLIKPKEIVAFGNIKCISAEPHHIKNYNSEWLADLKENYSPLWLKGQANCLLIKRSSKLPN